MRPCGSDVGASQIADHSHPRALRRDRRRAELQRHAAGARLTRAAVEDGLAREARRFHLGRIDAGGGEELQQRGAVQLPEGEVERRTEAKAIFKELKEKVMRDEALERGRRLDGRAFDEIRHITVEVGVLPRAHGSSVFTRGETQALVTATLGTAEDQQKIEMVEGETWKRFMLHYNFPPFSVGEVAFLRGPGRREVGHPNRGLFGEQAEHLQDQRLVAGGDALELGEIDWTGRRRLGHRRKTSASRFGALRSQAF